MENVAGLNYSATETSALPGKFLVAMASGKRDGSEDFEVSGKTARSGHSKEASWVVQKLHQSHDLRSHPLAIGARGIWGRTSIAHVRGDMKGLAWTRGRPKNMLISFS